jgi:hypothetical protein
MGRPTKEQTELKNKLKDLNILKRDMILYTYLEDFKSQTALEKAYNEEWEQRKIYNYELKEKNTFYYQLKKKFQNINLLSDRINLMFSEFAKEDEIFKKFGEFVKSNNLENQKNEEIISYLIFLIDIYFNQTKDIKIEKEDIYIIEDIYFNSLSDDLKEHIKEKYPQFLSTFKIMIANSKKNINKLKSHMIMQDFPKDEKITKLFEKYKDYTLIHSPKSKLDKKDPYIQIDLTQTDEEIIKNIKKIRKELKISILERHIIKDGISDNERKANILFLYDCKKIGLDDDYIQLEIKKYCISKNDSFQ